MKEDGLMRSSSPQKTIVTVRTVGCMAVLASRGPGGPPTVVCFQRSGGRRARDLSWGTRVTGCPSPGQKFVGKPEGFFDAICANALIGDGPRHWAIKKSDVVRGRRSPGGMTSLGVDDAKGGT
jgi:hypothetical protein